MIKNINKNYEKALKLYSNGNINKAIEIVDKGITNDLANSNLLNLKGLLLYIKGELDEAIVIWNINKDYNNDKISLSYLRDINNDYKKIQLYNEAELLIKNLNIDEALNLLSLCKESDFNYINVNLLIALCYFKKGNYDESQKYINKVLEVDKNNGKAITIKKEIDKFNGKNSFNKLSLILVAIILIITSVILKYDVKDLYKKDKNKEVFNNLKVQENSENDTNNNNEIVENIKEEDKEEIKQSNEEEKKEEAQKVEIKYLTDEEIINNYQEASDYYDKEDYTRTRDILKNTIIASKENYLKDDSIFLLAATYEKLSDNDNAIKEYEVYVNSYKDGAYIQESYYKLALLYKNINLKKSKEYANIIRNNYSDSIYNNNVMKEIIES